MTRVADLDNAANVQGALDEVAKIDEIAIVAAPGALVADVQTAIVNHCEFLGDRFAIIDGQQTTTIDVASIQGTVGVSDYAALYFPWIEVTDQTADAGAGARLTLPPSGHTAGLYARVDASRGVHKAPANEVVRGALDLEYLVTRA